jgi:hypothetical protein
MEWDTVWGVLGLLIAGGGLGALATVLGSWRESKNEHKKWLRDLRLKRYEEFVTAANNVVVAEGLGLDTDAEDLRLQAAQNVLALIGPEEMYAHAKVVVDYANLFRSNEKAMDAYLNAVADFNAQARKVLGIPHARAFSIGRP